MAPTTTKSNNINWRNATQRQKDQRDTKIEKLRGKGMTLEQIGQQTRTPPSTVRSVLNRSGLSTAYTKPGTRTRGGGRSTGGRGRGLSMRAKR